MTPVEVLNSLNIDHPPHGESNTECNAAENHQVAERVLLTALRLCGRGDIADAYNAACDRCGFQY